MLATAPMPLAHLASDHHLGAVGIPAPPHDLGRAGMVVVDHLATANLDSCNTHGSDHAGGARDTNA